MVWWRLVGCFFGGVFLVNSLPHLHAGVSGRRLQTPFAKPPFKGLSSPLVNMAWALFNLAVTYLLLARVAAVDFTSWAEAGACFAGFAAMGFQLARAFGQLRSEAAQPDGDGPAR